MRFQSVCIESVVSTLPPHVVTSDDIERELSVVYERLQLPAGRLELMTGIRERRFYEPGTLPGTVSQKTAEIAITNCEIDRTVIGALIHGSVCRDQMEPATAAGVHAVLGLSASAVFLDVSNACLGLMNGMLHIASMIELGQIRAGVVVGTETGRNLVEGTIDSLKADQTLTRQSIKSAVASLTIGSGSAAIVLCHRDLSRTGSRLLGGSSRSDTASHNLCAGGVRSAQHGDDRPRMETDSEALLHAGVNLAEGAWQVAKQNLQWSNDDVDKVFTHQVGRAHRRLPLERLQLDMQLDFPTVEFLGNTGAVALPTAFALGIERGHVSHGDRVALLGIGSGLSSVMLGVEWKG